MRDSALLGRRDGWRRTPLRQVRPFRPAKHCQRMRNSTEQFVRIETDTACRGADRSCQSRYGAISSPLESPQPRNALAASPLLLGRARLLSARYLVCAPNFSCVSSVRMNVFRFPASLYRKDRTCCIRSAKPVFVAYSRWGIAFAQNRSRAERSFPLCLSGCLMLGGLRRH